VRWLAGSLIGGLLLGGAGASSSDTPDYALQRAQLLEEIVADVDQTARYIDKQALDPRVMEALARVPRHEFVPESERRYAYENRPLPIGYGQTISQPYIVALMTDLAEVGPQDKALEVGTGSGYQAAVLAELVGRVYSIEIIPELAAEAERRLQRLGYEGVRTRVGDGYYGWPEAAPFDLILVTAAASHVPPPLIRQLKPGGRMVIPVGGRFQVQQLMLVEKSSEDEVRTRQVLPVRFVPLTGEH
jgi:protein-L-isoaspartate(D-aspartate) O-methyltransferase